jgi:hypothetical protein
VNNDNNIFRKPIHHFLKILILFKHIGKKTYFLVFESHKNISKYFYEISMSNKRREVLEVGIFSFCFPLFLFHATLNIWVLARSKWLVNCILRTLKQFSNIFMAPPLDKPHVGLVVVLPLCAFHYWVDSNLMFYVLSNFSFPPCVIPC